MSAQRLWEKMLCEWAWGVPVPARAALACRGLWVIAARLWQVREYVEGTLRYGKRICPYRYSIARLRGTALHCIAHCLVQSMS